LFFPFLWKKKRVSLLQGLFKLQIIYLNSIRKGGEKMTIQGTGMNTIWQMYQNASRNTVSEQDTSTEEQEKQEARQQLAVEGMNKPDRKGAPRVQAGPPPEMPIDTNQDGMWSEEEINELIETEDLDVSASEIISHYDTDGDSLINSEERETMRADNAFNLPKPRPGGPGGGMPSVSATDTEEEEEEEAVEEITNTFIKMVEQAYLNNSRDYITTGNPRGQSPWLHLWEKF